MFKIEGYILHRALCNRREAVNVPVKVESEGFCKMVVANGIRLTTHL